MGCTQVAFGRPVATSRLKSAAVYSEWLAQKETCDYDRRQRLLEVARVYRSLAGIIPAIPTQYKIKVGPSVRSAGTPALRSTERAGRLLYRSNLSRTIEAACAEL